MKFKSHVLIVYFKSFNKFVCRLLIFPKFSVCDPNIVVDSDVIKVFWKSVFI